MEKNIFENAYFGKPYKTRGEKKAIYWRHAYRHHLFTESGPIECDDSGKFSSCCPDLSTQFDIVGEWKEEVDKEKLDNMCKFRLPSKEEFDRLSECYTRFDNGLKGRWFYDEDTGEKLFLPCDGFRSYHLTSDAGAEGCYWSSTYYSNTGAYYFDFSIRKKFTVVGCRDNDYSVRLVSDEPFEGAVHVAGLYWKPTNEYGYHTYDEAMEKFNNK